MIEVISSNSSKVCDEIKKIFGLRDGIQDIQFLLDAKGMFLSVTYFVGTDEALQLTELLEEYMLVPKA